MQFSSMASYSETSCFQQETYERASSKAVQDKLQGLLLEGSLPNTFFLCSIRSCVCQVIPINSFCVNLP